MQLLYALALVLGIGAGCAVDRLEFCWRKKGRHELPRDTASASAPSASAPNEETSSEDASEKHEDLPHKKSREQGETTQPKRWGVRARPFVFAILLGFFFPAILFLYAGEELTLTLAIQVFSYAALGCILCAVIATDLDTMTIPNPLIVAGIILWLTTVWFISPDDYGVGVPFIAWVGSGFVAVLLDGLIAALIYGGGILVFSLVYEQVSKKPSLGGGDIKLLFMVSLFLGVYASVLMLFLACVLGLLFAPIWRTMTKRTSLTFPFGPSIALASMVSLILIPLPALM